VARLFAILGAGLIAFGSACRADLSTPSDAGPAASADSTALGNPGESAGGSPGRDSSSGSSEGFEGDGATILLRVLRGPIPACSAGAEHPNVCCASGPNQATVCTEDVASPFTPCAYGSLTFPDPRSCCPLDSSRPCAPPSPPDVIETTGNCSFPCGPGGFLAGVGNDAGLGDSCSGVDAGSCFYCCSGAGTSVSCVPNVWSCPPTPPGGPAEPCGPECPVCPAGWAMPSGFPDLCCTADGGGPPQCFSQAAGIASPSTGGPCSFASGQCECGTRGDDGHAYYMQCDSSGSPACTCIIDGKVVGHTAGTCTGSACGFPVSLP
jgi:hypothetical protein